MPRKKKPVEPVVAAPTEATAPTPSEREPVAIEPGSPPPPALVASKPETPTTTAAGSPDKIWATPGPRWETTITLGTRNDDPKMRVGRNNRYRQMVIQFDEVPCHDVLDRLHDAEWKRRPAEGVWTMQLDLGHEARGHRDAVHFFDDLVVLERKARGLDAGRAVSR